MGRRDAQARLAAEFSSERGYARRGKAEARRLEEKYTKLRRSPYKLFRATLGTFVADVESLPEWWRLPLHELDGALLGDAHPENFGAVGASAGEAQIDCTDFDVVATAPLGRDLARAACGLAIAEDQALPSGRDKDDHALAHALDGAPGAAALARVRLFALTYCERVLRGGGGLPSPEAFAPLVAAVDTRVQDVALDESTHKIAALDDRDGMEAAIAGWAEGTPPLRGATVVRAVRLHGKGASSYCVDRVVLQLRLGDGSERLVEWKPQADAASVRDAFLARRDPATRDPFLGVVAWRGVTHVAQRWLVDAQKVKAKDLRGDFADATARVMAVRLGALHRRLTPIVVERVRGQSATDIADALAELVAAYLPVLASEWRAFLDEPPARWVERVIA